MVKANSLLYAIYICLIVALLCGALLYIANLYNQLNLYYTSHEELFIQNESAVNYALAHLPSTENVPEETETGIKTLYTSAQYGLLTVLTAQSLFKNDTVTSVHFAGQYKSDKTCLYLTDFSKPLSYSGTVTLTGQVKLPSEYIRPTYIDSKPSRINAPAVILLSGRELPDINPLFIDFFKRANSPKTSIRAIDKYKDSLYYNSFTSATKELSVPGVLENITIKGNFILSSTDSIHIKQSAVLEDVIITAPKITIEEGFTGTIQAFATNEINVGRAVTLGYPSVLCIYNESEHEETAIKVGTGSKIYGGIVLFGFPVYAMDKNHIEIAEDGFLLGDIYCQGRLALKSNVFGSVYTNKFLYTAGPTRYENCIANVEINISKVPESFVSVSLFKNTGSYGIIKKLM